MVRRIAVVGGGICGAATAAALLHGARSRNAQLEVRVAAPDDIWLSTAFERPTAYVAIHQFHRLDHERYFLKTTDTDFDAVSRGATWYLFASTPKLQELLERPEPRRQSRIAVEFHRRVTRPVVGGLLVVLGLSVILRNPNRHVFISTGFCLGICAVFFGLDLACKFLGNNDYVSPPLAGWLPVLVFGPITIASFDAIHT